MNRRHWRNIIALVVLGVVLIGGFFLIRNLLDRQADRLDPTTASASVPAGSEGDTNAPGVTAPEDTAVSRDTQGTGETEETASENGTPGTNGETATEVPSATGNPNEIQINLTPPDDPTPNGILRRWPAENAVQYLHNTSEKLPAMVGMEKNNRPLQGITVFLDAARGGTDPGSVYPHGSSQPEAVEKEITLQVAEKTKAALEELGAGVVLTRTDDRQLGLYHRSALIGMYILTDFLNTAEAMGLSSPRLEELMPRLQWITEHNVDRGGGDILSGETTTTEAKLLYDIEAQYDDVLVLSLQVNNWPDDEGVHGMQVYYLTNPTVYNLSNQAVENDDEVVDPMLVNPVYQFHDDMNRERLARLVRDTVHEHIPELAADPVRQDLLQSRYSILRHNNLTNAVISLGYISNENDRNLITDPESQEDIAAAIADAVFRYYSDHPDPYPPESPTTTTIGTLAP